MARWTSWAVAISHLRPAELVMIPTGLSRLAGQAIRLVRRIRLSLTCFRLCGWGRQPVAQLVVSPTSVSARHGGDRLTRPAPAVRATGDAGWGRAARPDLGQLCVRCRYSPAPGRGRKPKGAVVHGGGERGGANYVFFGRPRPRRVDWRPGRSATASHSRRPLFAPRSTPNCE